ncbi:DUF4265 domain-containing protein [Caenorhabditis elegans]|uniref:DUF4265 domain-containing protein n=1 Tax=Caenorhabditis elegans TaxID=6239 RepID=Q7JNW8_CAEEL|nr:DUF4265 domain-containing protein [Caenorhabditis elegans]CCD63824.1 DUF4265 domain-containing protein [Caenorhabditis elegans]|eukprot:NP_001024599.1 Uncharacterized protein CELE_F22F4.5 [Caenorhabditis elegans]
MEILTVVVPDLIRYSKDYFMDNSLFQQIEHVRKGTLPAAVGPHPIRTMVDGIDYCATAIQVPITTQKKCDLVLHDCEKVSMDSAHLAEFLGEDTVFTLGKNKEGNVFFLLADRNPDKVLHAPEITKVMASMIQLTTNLKLRELKEIEQFRIPIELAGSFMLMVKCRENGKRTLELFDENMTQVGFVNGFVWREIVV